MLPLALSLGAWKLSLLVNSALGCHAVGKSPQACLVMGVDVQPALALGAWWGMLLWVPGLVLSGLLVGQVLAGKLPRPWAWRRTVIGSVKCQPICPSSPTNPPTNPT